MFKKIGVGLAVLGAVSLGVYLRSLVTLPDQPPDFAFAPSNPERPVRIHFVTHIRMGGIDIYRL